MPAHSTTRTTTATKTTAPAADSPTPRAAVYTKSAGLTGQSTEFNLPFSNNGTVKIQQGTFNLNDGGADPGDFDTSAGATIEVTGGTLTLNSPNTLTGPGLVQIDAGSLTANAVQSIANLEIDYATDFWGPIGGLFGSADVTVTGTFNWYGSYLGNGGGGLIVAPSATLNILGSNAHDLDVRAVTNDGTINWTGTGKIPLSGGGTIVNAGSFNVEANHSFSGSGTGSGLTGDGGTFNVAQGATLDLTGGGTVTYTGTFKASGAGTVALSSGTLVIGIGGATFDFPGSMFQWTGGAINGGSGDLTNRGTINLSGPNEKQIFADGTLDNFGTIIQTGTGNFGLHSDNQSPTTLLNRARRTLSHRIRRRSRQPGPWRQRDRQPRHHSQDGRYRHIDPPCPRAGLSHQHRHDRSRLGNPLSRCDHNQPALQRHAHRRYLECPQWLDAGVSQRDDNHHQPGEHHPRRCERDHHGPERPDRE